MAADPVYAFFTRVYLHSHRVKFGRGLSTFGRPLVSTFPDTSIDIGVRCRLRSNSYGNAIGVNHPVILRTLASGAVLEIGDDFAMSGGAICSSKLIIIGSRVMLGANVTISDSDLHPLDAGSRSKGLTGSIAKPVYIENDVWIGADVYVCKGVRIGTGSVVGAGSVVTKDVPPNCTVAGNPAVVIRHFVQ